MSELSIIDPKEIAISHIGNNGAVQSNEEHQIWVAQKTERFAAEFGRVDCGRFGVTARQGKGVERMAEVHSKCVRI